MPCIAKVAVNDATIHFDKLYSYLVPPDFSESLWPGSIVLVPFGRGNHPRMAVVLEVGTEEAPDRSTVQQLVRAGEFGPTVNVARKHLVTEDGLAEFIARRTGPAHSGLAPAPQTNYHHRHSDPGPI